MNDILENIFNELDDIITEFKKYRKIKQIFKNARKKIKQDTYTSIIYHNITDHNIDDYIISVTI
jgi:hypothetical protein